MSMFEHFNLCVIIFVGFGSKRFIGKIKQMAKRIVKNFMNE